LNHPLDACEESNPLEVAATIQPLQEVHERVEQVTRGKIEEF
jgi:hypothetical protein